jgi:hypothetical protein
VRHAYLVAGTYTATLSYAPPVLPCTDTRTGRGENPYASRAHGSVEVTVVP